MNILCRVPPTIVELLSLPCLLSLTLKFYLYFNHFRIMFITIGIQLLIHRVVPASTSLEDDFLECCSFNGTHSPADARTCWCARAVTFSRSPPHGMDKLMTKMLWHTKNYIFASLTENWYTLIHSHWTAIVLSAVVIFLLDNRRRRGQRPWLTCRVLRV